MSDSENKTAAPKRLCLLRHAKSDWKNSTLSDHDRPLNARGMRSAPLIAKYLDEHAIHIDWILASTATRVQQTLDLLLSTWRRKSPTIIKTESLYLASPARILGEVSKLTDEVNSVLVIGHNPGMADLASLLAARAVDFPTACLATFQVKRPQRWAEMTDPSAVIATLENYCLPRELE
jgi:phosphohistidine phosphatase